MIILLTILLFGAFLLAVFHVGEFWSNKFKNPRRPQLHHAYWGVILVLLALAVHWPVWVSVVGLLIMLDDTVQHTVQIWRPAYRSPLHLLARWIVYEPLARLRALRDD